MAADICVIGPGGLIAHATQKSSGGPGHTRALVVREPTSQVVW
jgi:hypothetical protein